MKLKNKLRMHGEKVEMSSMYKLPPLVPVDLDVKPVEIMYHIPSYHAAAPNTAKAAVVNGLPEETYDPVKDIESKQHALIKSLMNLGATMDSFLKEIGKPEKSSAKEVKKAPEPSSSAQPGPAKDSAKKDKEAKKEARKAAKSEAKSKIAAGAPVPGGKSGPSASDKGWTVNQLFQEEKQSPNSGQSLTACLPQTFVDFEKQKMGDVALIITSSDQPWVQALSRLGSARGVAFKGSVSNSCEKPLTTLEMVINGKLNSDVVIREASQYLSQFDGLGSQYSFGVADICPDYIVRGSPEQRRVVVKEIGFFIVICIFVLLVVVIPESVSRMPFMHGTMPLRRTFYYLLQGKIKFRDDVQVFAMGFHRNPTDEQKGAREFVFWHWAQLQYKNPRVQLVKHVDMSSTSMEKGTAPRVAVLNSSFLSTSTEIVSEDGREVLFDLEGMTREEIESRISTTLGKTELVAKREELMEIAKLNPADFGSKCKRQCMCEVQGQHPCTALLQAPKYMTGKWRWNHNLI
ncbi:unnamed protein product [Nippostrongylus brasiliensis]|uniref:Small ribosomal subunit protein mS25 n=1 Tax=Nippostrongylus brasiliensis TaxID=27835 RepID=A0A0N4YPC9_NIPBR|nr:unnamed protein product [Nippostrongylus brasiliensis]